MRLIALAFVLTLAACDEPSEAEQKAARDAAVAEVEANRHPPTEQLELDPIRYPEIEKHNLHGAGCSFTPTDGGLGTVALVQPDRGYMIRKGELLTFSPDAGSAEGPFGTRRKYDGLRYALEIVLHTGSATSGAYEVIDYRGTLTVRDERGDTVYNAPGLIQCGS